MNKQFLFFTIFIVFVIGLVGIVFAAIPNGVTVSPGESTNGYTAADTPGNHSAIAGNVTEINLNGNSITQTWQGYYGNVTGRITLTDGTGNVFYNWTEQGFSSGKVLASTNDSITWSNIGCFNLAGDAEVTGANLTTLEAAFNIGPTDVDGVDETFASNDHAEFILASQTFTSGLCNNTKLFGSGATPLFDEVLMYDSGTNSTVFASLMNESVGFDDATHDFEMLVLEDGHGTDVATTAYYFYMEL